MNSSDENFKLPNWLFIVTDVALIAVAAVIATRSAHPLSTNAMFGIVICVGLGALGGLVPLIIRFERMKNEALDDRQRALEALAQTVSSSAEQISIAAAGLNQITELTHKNLKHAEQLPHKLQDKIAEFQAQLAVASDAEKEELERELLSLRTTESERLESVSQRIAKSAADWTKLEQATHQHLAAATETLAKLSLGTASAIGKAQVAAEQALSQARIEAARSLGEASGQATRAIESSKQAGIAQLDAKLATATEFIVERVVRELSAKLAVGPNTLGVEATNNRGPGVTETVPHVSSPMAEDVSIATPSVPSPSNAEPATATKRARKPRSMEPVVAAESVPPAPAPASDDLSAPKSAEVTKAIVSPAIAAAEPPPVIAEKIAEVSPVAPLTKHPFPGHVTNGTAPEGHAPDAAPVPDVAKPTRKRPAAKNPVADVEPGLGLDLGDTSQGAASVSERVITSDGATRLLVTSYIGIGNRLFIRGDGPGLSWEKGVPLQFVSIGKWRWETNDANAPVEFKIYKNDEVECAALGAQKVEAGYQQELTAAF